MSFINGVCITILQPLRVEVLYWSIDSDEKLFSSDVFPVTYTNNINKEEFYSIPVHEYPGLTKVWEWNVDNSVTLYGFTVSDCCSLWDTV